MEFRTYQLSHPPTLLLKKGGESGCTKSVGCSRVHEHLVQTGLFLWIFFFFFGLFGRKGQVARGGGYLSIGLADPLFGKIV